MGGYDIVVEFLHQEMRIAPDTNFGELDKCSITTVSVYCTGFREIVAKI